MASEVRCLRYPVSLQRRISSPFARQEVGNGRGNSPSKVQRSLPGDPPRRIIVRLGRLRSNKMFHDPTTPQRRSRIDPRSTYRHPSAAPKVSHSVCLVRPRDRTYQSYVERVRKSSSTSIYSGRSRHPPRNSIPRDRARYLATSPSR